MIKNLVLSFVLLITFNITKAQDGLFVGVKKGTFIKMAERDTGISHGKIVFEQNPEKRLLYMYNKENWRCMKLSYNKKGLIDTQYLLVKVSDSVGFKTILDKLKNYVQGKNNVWYDDKVQAEFYFNKDHTLFVVQFTKRNKKYMVKKTLDLQIL